MDLTIFNFLNGLSGHSPVWDKVIVFFAAYSQYAIGLALAVTALRLRRIRMAVAALAAAIVARLGIKTLLLLFVHRPRPYVALSNVHNIIGVQTGEELQSFPSGHAIFFFALAMAVYMYDKRLGWWFFAGATLMGLSRVIGGIHWPGDIIGGAVLGVLTAWIMLRCIPALRPRPNA